MSGANLGHAACQCHGRADCDTCSTFALIFDGLAARKAEATEHAVQARLISLALDREQAATRRRPVRDMPHRLRVDLNALADAIALRLRRAP